MSVRFGKDGTLYCNTVKYNYKQARNMLADGNIGSAFSGGVWSLYRASITDSTHGYRTWRCFHCTGAYPIIRQNIGSTYRTHKYYISFYYMHGLGTVSPFEWRVYAFNPSVSGSNTALYFPNLANKEVSNPSVFWTKVSDVGWAWDQSGSNTFTLNIDTDIGSEDVYISKLILIDLTDTFGEGNEPSKEWLDNNIREHRVFANYGCTSSVVSPSTYNNEKTYTFSNFSKRSNYNFGQLDSNWEPRDYLWYLQGNTSATECYITSASNYSLESANKYYFQIETTLGNLGNGDYNSGVSFDSYFPIAEPKIGEVAACKADEFNGGGGMRNWKRISMCAVRNMFSNGNQKLRFDLNNHNTTQEIRVTGIQLTNVNKVLNDSGGFHTTFGNHVTADEANVEWCDCWIDGRNSSIIHIGDPKNTEIKFTKPVTQAETHVRSYTTEQLNNIATLKNDYWGAIANISSFKAGDITYVLCQNSTTNKPARVVVKFLRAEGSTMYVDSMGWGEEGTYWWNFCEGYDIVCNDIYIGPFETNVTLKKNGMIYCKKLVRTQSY